MIEQVNADLIDAPAGPPALRRLPRERRLAATSRHRRISRDAHAELVGPDGAHTPLPAAVYEVLCHVVLAMARGQAVTIAPHHQQLTTRRPPTFSESPAPRLSRCWMTVIAVAASAPMVLRG